MAEQPYYRPYDPSAFFTNGQSAQPLPEGVIARSWLLADNPLTSGLKAEFRKPPAEAADSATKPAVPPVGVADDPGHFVEAVPFVLTRDDLLRGQDRFTIFCTACHGPLGDANGKIPERGYLRPPNYHTDESRGFAKFGKHVLLRDAPLGYFFEVITKGYGGMPRYGPQLDEQDRWRVAAYVRALQLSQHTEVEKLPSGLRQAAQDALKEAP